MNVIYVNYRPNRVKGKPDEFTDYNVLTMIVSSLQMRKSGFFTKLYGDMYTVRRMEELQLTEVWNSLDATSLDRTIDKKVYDLSYFFNIAKFFALSMEPAPSMLMDIDLILWENPEKIWDQSAVFTHWESVRPCTKWYCRKDKILLPDGYKLPKTWDFRLPATNTSIMYFRDDDMKSYYCEEAMRFMRNNFPDPGPVHSEVYFVEQRMFLMCLKEKGFLEHTKPLIDQTWNPSKGRFSSRYANQEGWLFFKPEENERITHTWIVKSEIAKNQKYRDYYCCRLLEKIWNLAPGLFCDLRKRKMFNRYFDLLDQFGSVASMLEAGAVSDKL